MRFYDRSGKLVEGATVRDAKRDGLFKSVSTVLDIIRKPGVEYWREDLVIQETWDAAALFRDLDEARQHLKKRLWLATNKDAIHGTKIHKNLSDYFSCGLMETEQVIDDETMSCVLDCLSRNNIKIELTEVAFANTDQMLGGTIDAIGKIDGELMILDWKTQNIKNGKPKFYTTWGLQLAPYASYGLQKNARILNMIIPRNDDEQEVYLKEWHNKEELLSVFDGAHRLWKFIYGEEDAQNN